LRRCVPPLTPAWLPLTSIPGHLAQAAHALDDLRAELAHADRLVAEQQTRIGTLYVLFTEWDGGGE
jgi:hypothetical protein